MNLLRKKPGVSSDSARRLKEWTRELWGLSEDTALVVLELACREPGCAPVETVVATLGDTGQRRSVKVPGAASGVTREDLVRAMKRDH